MEPTIKINFLKELQTSIGEPFEQIFLRGGYHDLLDPSDGYPLDSQVELLSLSLRHNQDTNKVIIDALDFVDVVSLMPYHPLFFRPSWKLKFKITNNNDTIFILGYFFHTI